MILLESIILSEILSVLEFGYFFKVLSLKDAFKDKIVTKIWTPKRTIP